MENKSHSSCISPAATSSMSAGESSWAVHIANFLASSPPNPRDSDDMDQEEVSDGSFSSSFNSFDDDVSFITSEMICGDEEDESLQDTACSSAAEPKITGMGNLDMMKSMAFMDARELNMPQLAKYFIDVGSRQQLPNTEQDVNNSYTNNQKALYESNELRKKGLCLVPISMLIDYLG